MQQLKILKVFFLLLITFMTISSTKSISVMETHRRMMVGGYSPVETTDPPVVTAAELVVLNLAQGKGPADKYSFSLTSTSNDDGDVEIKVLEASQQVRV